LEGSAWPVNCATDPAVLAAGGNVLCAQLLKAARHREVVVTIVDDLAQSAESTSWLGGGASDSGLAAFLAAAPPQVLVVTRGERARAKAEEQLSRLRASSSSSSSSSSSPSYGHFHVDTSSAAALATLPPLALKYSVLGGVLRAGCGVLFAHTSTVWHDGAHVFGYLSRDSDIEAASGAAGGMGGGMLSTGRVVSVDDGQMGWSRYAQSLAISGLSPNLFFAAATHEAASVMAFLQLTFSRPEESKSVRGPEGTTRDEMYELTQEVFAPAHDAKRSAGASVRILPPSCFAVGRGSVAAATASASGGGGGGGMAAVFGGSANAILTSRAFDARPQVLRQGCAKVSPPEGSPPSRPLNYVVPQESTEWPKPEACESLGVQGLCSVLKTVHRQREVLAAVSNKNIFHMLQLFVNGIKAANVSNAMVVSLDDATESWCHDRSVPTYKKKLVSRTGSTDNHATSGLKFKILVDFLSVGASVLLSDVDVIWLADPFPYLYKDTDVEGMTDGWDEPTSYGYNYNGGGYRVFARNSGMFYLQATHEANQMMKRLAWRMEREGTWDQTAYNEEQFYPAHGTHGSVGVSSRVMNYLCNMNSKTFFRFVREDAELLRGYRPLSMHVNYHPEKPQRMVDLHAFYYLHDDQKGSRAGIWKWNGGEGSRLQSECRAAMHRGQPPESKPLVQRILLARKAMWGGIKWIEFDRSGHLKTPWGEGTWGDASDDSHPNRIFAEFISVAHLLTFSGDEYESVRCSDGEAVKGRLAGAGEA
jgi:hypothetical protein